MSRPYWSIKHVGTMSQLPEKLTRGRAYFVDDEQVIVVDHGQGAVIYGGRPGPQGQAGEPLPQLQDQIDKLAQAELTTQTNIWNLVQRTDARDEALQTDIDLLGNSTEQRFTDTLSRIEQEAQTAQDFTAEKVSALQGIHEKDLTHIHTLITDTGSRLQSQADNHTEAMLSLIMTMQEKFASYDNALAIITKTISSLYPSPYAEEQPEDPLDGETITTEAGTWKIEQTYLDDGTIMLELDADELLITTLQVGDKVDYDGSTWQVVSKTEEDGMLTLTLEP